MPAAVGFEGSIDFGGAGLGIGDVFFQHEIVANAGDVAVEADVFDHALDPFGIGVDAVGVGNFGPAFPGLDLGDGGEGISLILGLDVVDGYIGKIVEGLFIVVVVFLFVGCGNDHEVAHVALVVFLDEELAGSGLDELEDFRVLVHPQLDRFGHEGLFDGHDVQHLGLPFHGAVAALLVHRQVGDLGVQVLAGDHS